MAIAYGTKDTVLSEGGFSQNPNERSLILRNLREEIIALIERREALREQMTQWHSDGRATRFPFIAQLRAIDTQIENLDARYKALQHSSRDSQR